jgi:hypothetical protein
MIRDDAADSFFPLVDEGRYVLRFSVASASRTYASPLDIWAASMPPPPAAPPHPFIPPDFDLLAFSFDFFIGLTPLSEEVVILVDDLTFVDPSPFFVEEENLTRSNLDDDALVESGGLPLMAWGASFVDDEMTPPPPPVVLPSLFRMRKFILASFPDFFVFYFFTFFRWDDGPSS